MNEYELPNPRETLPAGSVSSVTSGPSVAGGSGGDATAPSRSAASSGSASVTGAKQARSARVRGLLSTRRRRWTAATGHFPPGGGFAGGAGRAGSNARSGPAAGGAVGTVGSVSTSSFTMSTAAGQKVTVKEASTTVYKERSTSASASAITTGEPVLAIGTTSGTTITATQVIVQPSGGGSATSSAATVVPFQRGAPTTSEQVGQIPANYSEGSGTIVSGTAASKATEAALAVYPGGVVDRVVKVSNGEYEVHNIGVNWPHHIFVNQNFRVVGAD
jgi:hypothetical protein